MINMENGIGSDIQENKAKLDVNPINVSKDSKDPNFFLM